MWTLNEAINFVQSNQANFKTFGYHIGLIGSVLNDGFSKDDLDIVVLPYEDKNITVDRLNLIEFLNNFYGAKSVLTAMQVEYEENNREIFKADKNGRIIDFFVY